MLITKAFMTYLLSDTLIRKLLPEISESVGKMTVLRACVEKGLILRVTPTEWLKPETKSSKTLPLFIKCQYSTLNLNGSLAD